MTQPSTLDILSVIFSGLATVIGLLLGVLTLFKRPLKPVSSEKVDNADAAAKMIESAVSLGSAYHEQVQDFRSQIATLNEKLKALEEQVKLIPVLQAENVQLREANTVLTEQVEVLRIQQARMKEQP